MRATGIVGQGRSDKLVLGLFVASQFVIPFLSIVILRQWFALPFRTIYYHMVVIAGANAACLAVALLINRVRSGYIRMFAAYFLSLLLGCFSLLVIFIHLFAWAGNLTIGRNISLSMLMPFVTHLGSTSGTFGVPSHLVWAILFLVPTAIAIFYVGLTPTLFARLVRFCVYVDAHRGGLILRFQHPPVIASVIGIILGAAYLEHKWPVRKELLGGEPITAILFSGDDFAPFLPISKSGSEDDIIRRDYVHPAHFEKKNVILIVVDDLRPDHLGFMGYTRNTCPFLDGLYREGNLRVVRASFANAPWSFGGILSILRSKHWFHMGARSFAIQDVLKDAGYQVHFILSSDHTYFCRLKSFYGNSLDSFCDGSLFRSFGPNDDRGVFEALQGIRKFEGVPTFFYFHLMSVHCLGPRLPENVRFSPASLRHEGGEFLNNYDNGVFQADDNIRELFLRLKQMGYLQNSIVVITADHGESLGERNCFGHGTNLYNEELKIPVMIYDAGGPVYKNVNIARQIDIAPTILDRLGLPVPSSWDGCSLLSSDPERYSYHLWGSSYAVIDYTTARTLKYMYNERSKAEEIYDLTTDPHETHNLVSLMDHKQVGGLRKALGSFPIHPTN
jgi:glucan phosphoethanolaminetransferase (alkaline phosphatase superfamily)